MSKITFVLVCHFSFLGWRNYDSTSYQRNLENGLCVCYSLNHVQLFVTPWAIYSPWNSPGQNTGVGSLSLLQGIFPTQGSNWVDSLPAELQGNPKNTGVGSYPFSSGSSWPGNWTRVSWIAGGFFTNWAIRGRYLSIQLLHFTEDEAKALGGYPPEVHVPSTLESVLILYLLIP